MPKHDDLIFDIGLHDGSDTAFYLEKGFRVVALEANEKLVDSANRRFAREIKSGRLVVVDSAISDREGTIDFYVSAAKDDWSSIYEVFGNRAGDATVVKVEAVTLGTLFKRFGVPYYLKIDVEGVDNAVISSLLTETERPSFASVELSSFDSICSLRCSGYDRFQLANQNLNWMNAPPRIAREGKLVEWSFSANSSGCFGLEMPGKWVDVETCADLYLGVWNRLRNHPQLFNGWFDIHATTSETLERAKLSVTKS